MSFLILYLGEERRFDVAEAESAIRSLKGIKLLAPSDDCLSAYEFHTGDDFTVIRVRKEGGRISIDGTGDASIAAAFHIQSKYPDAIHMVDEGYSFDLDLSEFASIDELKQRILDADV